MAKKHKGAPEIPRDDYVYGHASKKTSQLTITVDPSGRIFIPELDPSSIRRQITHARKNKDDKVLYSAPADDFGVSLNPIEHLKTKFDFMLAVDTNTIRDANGPVRFNGYTASACTVVVISEPLQEWGTEIQIKPLASYLILDSGDDIKTEPLGWHLALTRHTDTPFLQSKRVGMVVDSELGKHIDINARRLPYYADHLLPNNTALVYASSDKAEMFANKMLKYCDNLAGQLLERFEKIGIGAALKASTFQLGSARCFAICHVRKPLVKT
ncbi:hypothetical protein [Pseudomonas fontis]|uniref:Uncharacterized protein n=1 Tax=Pseudomonas fontis TaxID=2942633 RepID=A0ABT5NQF7_9PSED|nr:hypothetical protein [Pseudomonas fontis]MDD0974659.1 hypothetical protein [Pseudomonas fontis]MDD0990398.1 hypothetical protein [Pseudomonas fontis]